MTVSERISAIYDPRSNCIHPFIGASFAAPSDALRIMAVGINCYSEAAHFGRQPPGLFAEWFEKGTHRYQRGVWRDLQSLAAGLAKHPFADKRKLAADKSGVYLTNAVKVYMRDVDGKRAEQLDEAAFTVHLDQWRDELDVLADADVMPDIIAIIGDPFWKYACASFSEPTFARLRVVSYESCKEKSLHFANRLVLDGGRRRVTTLLVRLRHPAARTVQGSPAWLLEQPDFVRLARAREA